MRLANVTIGVFLFLELALLSLYAGYAAAVGGSTWSGLSEWLSGHRVAVLAASASNLVLFVLLVATSFRRLGQSDRYLSFDSDGGSVNISLKAVSDFVSSVGGEFAAIQGLKPLIRVPGGQLEIEADLKVKAGAKVPELCQMLQQRIRQTIEENLGFTDIRSIKIKVRDIVGDASPAVKPSSTQAG